MRYRTLGNSDLVCSVVGIGTWGLSGMGWEGSHRSSDEQSIATIREAVDAGITLIDTALTYGAGHAEELVGEATEDIRDRVVIATKCVADRLEDQGLIKDWRPDTLKAQLEKSLRRLRTDWIDLYQVHWPDPDPSHPLKDAFRQLARFVEEGSVRYVGVSNFDAALIEEASAYCPITSVQPGYSLLNRGCEKELLPYCEAHNIGVLSYGSLGGGILTGKYTQRPEFRTVDGAADPRNAFYPYYSEKAWPHTSHLIEEMRAIADKNGCRVVDVAVSWVLAQQAMSVALVGCRTQEQARKNAAAGDYVLSEEDTARLTKISDEVLEAIG